jgi:hypothetical protein
MPQVIAVGGVTIDSSGTPSAWRGTSCFATASDPPRLVPDICGIASEMAKPMPGNRWSAARVRRHVRRLKSPPPQFFCCRRTHANDAEIRTALMMHATDVQLGATNSGTTSRSTRIPPLVRVS